jgi:hypothetical protein
MAGFVMPADVSWRVYGGGGGRCTYMSRYKNDGIYTQASHLDLAIFFD